MTSTKAVNRIWRAVERYAQARVNDSWKGGGDPANEPAIEYNLKSTKAVLRAIIEEEVSRGSNKP